MSASNGERERERERERESNDSLSQTFFFKNFHTYPLFHILIVDIDYFRFKMCKILCILANIVCTSI